MTNRMRERETQCKKIGREKRRYDIGRRKKR
jgi:hypothetical protein